MNQQPLKHTKINEDIVIASRRKFLKKLACGSFFALSGSGVATAAVRDIIYPAQPGRGSMRAQPTYTLDQQVNSPIFMQRTQAAAPYLQSLGEKALSFEHTHTGDKLKLTYFERGNYIEDALQEINYLLRDFRTDDIHPIDTALLDQLFDLKQILGINKPFHIVSGYQCSVTQA